MRILCTLTLLFIHFVTSAQTNPKSPEEYFDFWLGKWEATWDEKDGKKGHGVNHVTKVLDSQVIQENFEILEGTSKGFKGMSISTYQSRFLTWKQAWADSQGDFYYFLGKLEGKKRIFQTEVFDQADGKKFTQRMVFYDILQDSFTWDWEASTDGGQTWVLNWRIQYTRSKD